MIDPMTSNGVTAALRQAREAAQLIVKSRTRKRLPRMATIAYTWRVVGMARFLNCTIERLVYEWPVRKKIGLLTAGDIYTTPAWLINLFYSRSGHGNRLHRPLWLCAYGAPMCGDSVPLVVQAMG